MEIMELVKRKKRNDSRELCKGIDPSRPIPYDEISEAEKGRIGPDRKDFRLAVSEIKKKTIDRG